MRHAFSKIEICNIRKIKVVWSLENDRWEERYPQLSYAMHEFRLIKLKHRC